jgi:hypothetical protein
MERGRRLSIALSGDPTFDVATGQINKMTGVISSPTQGAASFSTAGNPAEPR